MEESDIIKKYPLAFSDDSMQPIVLFGLEISKGWYPLIENLCNLMYRNLRNINYSEDYYNKLLESKNFSTHSKEQIEEMIEKLKKNKEDVINEMPKIEQVKEKFGTLRIYVSHMNMYIDGAIDMAEAMSEHICEECGDKGKLYEMGWHKTLCKKHAYDRYGDKINEIL